jgi:spectinomycin phosphotransferase
MISEPNIDRKKLQELLASNFGFSINEIIFNPKGEASWSYIILTDKEKFFLKFYEQETFDLKTFDFIVDLYTKCKIENIIHPVETVSGEIALTFDSYKLVLFNFIDGKTIREQPLNEIQLLDLGELLAKTHQSFKEIGPYEVREKFESPFKKNILKIYAETSSSSDLNQIQQQAKQIYVDYKEKFLDQLFQLEKISDSLKNQNIEFVNCHGEPSPENIMVSEDGKIYLIDWDFPIFAPKEKDLMFFKDQPEVLNGYKKIFSEVKINEEVEKYYKLLWNVQEIEDWGTRLFLKMEKEDEHNLKELINFLDYSGLKNG